MSPLNPVTDVIKHMPSVTLNERDDSEVNPNASDLSLRGDNNTVNVTSTSDIQQKKPMQTNLVLILLILSNIISSALIVTLYQRYTDNFTTTSIADHAAIRNEAHVYTDDAVASAFNKIKTEFAQTTADALSSAVATAQDGNRNIIRIQLIGAYDAYLIDGATTIKRRDLDGIRDMYAYYLSIHGNHDVPPRAFMFEQMLAKHQIQIIE